MSGNVWRDAVHNALTANCQNPIGETESPNDALHRLIEWEITLALEPTISQSAADLVSQSKQEILDEAIKIVSKATQRGQAIDRLRALGGKK
jgi:hypothetical protein